MNRVFYVISVMVDSSGEVLEGSEEAVCLLTNPVAIAECQEIQETKKYQDVLNKINCVSSHTVQ